MNTYRGIEYSIWNTHYIKLVDKNSIKKDGRELLRRGELYLSLPMVYVKCPDVYARRSIDMLYDRMDYFEKMEIQERLR